MTTTTATLIHSYASGQRRRRFVVDANALFAFVKPDSAASRIVTRFSLMLIAPSHAMAELGKHKEELTRKAGLPDFATVNDRLKTSVIFAPAEDYIHFLDGIALPDLGDLPYLALAKRLQLPIWSNDPHLKEQEIVDVLSTRQMIELLGG